MDIVAPWTSVFLAQWAVQFWQWSPLGNAFELLPERLNNCINYEFNLWEHFGVVSKAWQNQYGRLSLVFGCTWKRTIPIDSQTLKTYIYRPTKFQSTTVKYSSKEQQPWRGAGAMALILVQQLWKLSQAETAQWMVAQRWLSAWQGKLSGSEVWLFHAYCWFKTGGGASDLTNKLGRGCYCGSLVNLRWPNGSPRQGRGAQAKTLDSKSKRVKVHYTKLFLRQQSIQS